MVRYLCPDFLVCKKAPLCNVMKFSENKTHIRRYTLLRHKNVDLSIDQHSLRCRICCLIAATDYVCLKILHFLSTAWFVVFTVHSKFYQFFFSEFPHQI